MHIFLKAFAAITCCALLTTGCDHQKEVHKATADVETISVMSFNILYSTPHESTLKTIQDTNADIIGLQEMSASRLSELAAQHHFYFHNFRKSTANMSDDDTGILSRYPMTRFFDDGVVIKVRDDLQVAVFNVHLTPYPYEPYDFRDNKISTPEQAVSSASHARLPQINPVLDQIKTVLNEGIPVFLMGDFNEPSTHDWTSATAAKKMHFSKIVPWPVSEAVEDAGLIDIFRQKFPDPVRYPGNTWTTIEAADEVYDRNDIIYHNQHERLELTDLKTVGAPDDAAGITVDGYASDHYALLANYKIKPQ